MKNHIVKIGTVLETDNYIATVTSIEPMASGMVYATGISIDNPTEKPRPLMWSKDRLYDRLDCRQWKVVRQLMKDNILRMNFKSGGHFDVLESSFVQGVEKMKLLRGNQAQVMGAPNGCSKESIPASIMMIGGSLCMQVLPCKLWHIIVHAQPVAES